MVTSRQLMRGVGRTMRAIDREAQRSARRREAYERAAQKQAMLEAAADAVAEYEAMFAELVRPHAVQLDRMNWRRTAEREPLPAPVRLSLHEEAARKAEEAYVPGWFAKTFGLAASQRQRLAQAVVRAAAQDTAAFEKAEAEAKRINDEIAFARRVIALDKEAVVEVLSKQSGLGSLAFCLEEIDVWFSEDGRIIARVDGLDVEDMPTQSASLLQSGKASFKNLSSSRILEIHRDNICGSALRIAVEFLNVLPIDAVGVEMKTDVLDPATGHIEPRTVLRVTVAAQAVASLHLARAEPAAVVERLGGEFIWSKRDGFRALAEA